MDKFKLIDNVPTLEEIQKVLSEQAIKLAEEKAMGEEPLKFVDYLNICSPFGIPDTSINRGYARLRNFVEGNFIRVNLETPHLDLIEYRERTDYIGIDKFNTYPAPSRDNNLFSIDNIFSN